MVSYLPTLDAILARKRINVTVYEGQVDLICLSAGAERWMSKLEWAGMQQFYATQKQAFFTPQDAIDPAGFGIVANNGLSMYYVMQAGHMVPADQPVAALEMVKQIISQ